MSTEAKDLDAHRVWTPTTRAHKNYLDARLEGIEDRGEWVNEILNQHARYDDPDSCTDEDRARAFGKNWREVIAVIQRAASLTREEAERIAAYSLQEYELDNFLERVEEVAVGDCLAGYDLAGDAGDIACEPMFSRGDVYWETRNAYLAALMAAVAGDGIPENLRSEMTRAWNAR
ncbi:hypothetical protein [Streptomyces sp. NPDC059076]|uniref:hypothetical protein n=1 Tax=unclassified Streptomyces TaxID=2593676 RepID=UPI0036AAF141